jgi:hypothetical protein
MMLGAGLAAPVEAQVTTGGISGRVTSQAGEPLESVQLQVRNAATGRVAGTSTRQDGRFTVLGLEVGAQYVVTARRIGYAPTTIEDVRVQLGQNTPVDIVLQTAAAQLAEVTISAEGEAQLISPERRGTATSVSDTLIRRLPTLNRNFTDFVTLTPQVGSSGPGLSGAGTNNRFNNIQIDGATESDLFGLGSTGQPGGQAGGKSIGIESVKEYQVLLAPYDVRQGNFSGVLINAVTKSGQNDFFGSIYGYGRNQDFVRSQDYISDFKQYQYGFSLGGPIVRDRAFFFINPEFQQRSTPAFGPSLGDGSLSLTQAHIDRFTNALEAVGMTNLGSGSAVTLENPLANVFARVDVILPWNSTLVLRHNYGGAEDDIFSRATNGSDFPLTNASYFFESKKNATVAQLRTNFENGSYNEFNVGYTTIRDRRTPVVRGMPQVTTVFPGVATLRAGSERFSHGNELDQDIIEISDSYTMPLGSSHRLTIGTQNTFYKARNLFAQSTGGAWIFDSPELMEAGDAREYIVGVPVEGDGAVRINAFNWSVFAQDEWTVNDNFNMNFGVRVEAPTFRDKPPYNPTIEADFGRRTDEVPSNNITISPRFGFNWNVTGDGVNQLRGGVGVFTGRPAYVWLSNAFQNSGGMSGVALLTCRAAQGVPAFNAVSVATPPVECVDGTTAAAGSEVNLLSKDLKFPQNLRGNLAYDRSLFDGRWVATFEGVYTRGLNNLFYINRALAGPVGTDPDGRVLYGLTPNNPALVAAGRTTVLDVENQSKDYSYSLTAGLTRNFADGFGGSVFYTYTQAKDVQNLTSSTAFSQYRFGRSYAGRQDDLSTATSLFEQPHRIVAMASYTAPSQTTFTVLYRGESGQAFNYVSSGDLNGDGFTQNDPVYIPTGADDPRAPQFDAGWADFTAAEQSDAFFAFIENAKCLREQRGKIMERNSCRAPFSNRVDVALEQALPTFRGQNLTVRVDVINFLNLLNKDWGKFETQGFASQNLYDQRSVSNGNSLATGVPVVRFNPTYEQFTSESLASNWQMQFSVRYSF